MTEQISRKWQREIDAAQQQTTDEILGVTYPRIRYGRDYPNGRESCRDCGVEHGQFHVIGCCVERCARCKKGQALCCDCGLH